METKIATVNEVLELIAQHPAGYLIKVASEMWGGNYDKTYPGKLSVEGKDWTFSTKNLKVYRTIEEVRNVLDSLVLQSSASGWALGILKQNSFHTDAYLSTRGEDEARFLSAEKMFFRNRYGEDTRIFHLGDFRVSFRFYVTSFQASISMRTTFCPEAIGEKASPHLRANDFDGIGVYGWGKNGSGFNQKYIEAIKFLQRFIDGNWEGVAPHWQDNRSSSINARTGEHNTHFWSAQLTFPEKAHAKATFPLFVGRLLFPLED